MAAGLYTLDHLGKLPGYLSTHFYLVLIKTLIGGNKCFREVIALFDGKVWFVKWGLLENSYEFRSNIT